ncbi:UNVERIFIED_CONTAM: hypothetical protein FKN15_074095 [Acipenser sinensis]
MSFRKKDSSSLLSTPDGKRFKQSSMHAELAPAIERAVAAQNEAARGMVAGMLSKALGLINEIHCVLGDNRNDAMSWICSVTSKEVTNCNMDISNPREKLRVALQNECRETLVDGSSSG